MQNTKLYMQIHRSNLADYINKAIILPSKYIQKRTEEDIQSKNENFILLSDGYFEQLSDSQVLLEIVLTEKEISSLVPIQLTVDTENKIYACKVPLPIIRVRTIYIGSNEIKKQYQSTFHIGDVGYLPADRLKILPKNFSKKLQRYTLSSFIIKDKTIKWSKFSKNSTLYPYKPLMIESNETEKKLLKYDKVMGMFAFIKNTDFYFADRKQHISNYSNHYFSLLGLLNKKINEKESSTPQIDENKLAILKILLQLGSPNTLIQKLYTTEQIDERFIKEIAEKSKNKDTLYKLFDEMEKIEALESLKDQKDFYLAYLYFNRFDGDMESLKAKILDIEDIGKAERLLAMFGLYYGYSKIRAREEILIEDDIFKNFLIDKREKNIKFMLDSKLDYITIESIYQYAFNSKISNEEFDYLPYPKAHKSKCIKGNKNWYTQNSKKIIDVAVITLSKKSWESIVKYKLEKYSKKITSSTKGLWGFLYDNQNSLIKYAVSNSDTQKTEFWFIKEEIAENLLNIADITIQDKLFNTFHQDKK